MKSLVKKRYREGEGSGSEEEGGEEEGSSSEEEGGEEEEESGEESSSSHGEACSPAKDWREMAIPLSSDSD